MKNKLRFLGLTLFAGLSVARQSFAAAKDIKELINDVLINTVIRPIVPLLVGLAVLFFIYGVFKYIFAGGGEKKEEGKNFMVWGIVGLFVMVSVWGIVAVLVNTFNLDTSKTTVIQLKAPQINTNQP